MPFDKILSQLSYTSLYQRPENHLPILINLLIITFATLTSLMQKEDSMLFLKTKQYSLKDNMIDSLFHTWV